MEDMNEKKRSASSEASSPRPSKQRCVVDELFTSVRNNVALATIICSFLPIKDRVRLGQVDKQFYEDEHRGQIVGVYGDDSLDIEAALEKVREYAEYESTLDAWTEFGNTPDCWQWVYVCGEASSAADKIQDSWFDKELGWDLKAIQEHAGFDEEDQEFVLEGLASANRHLRGNQKKLEKISVIIKKLGPLAPYNSLFDLMKKYNMEYNHFLHAEKPTMYGFSEYAYEIGDSYLEHLRPGRMLSFRDANGKMVKIALKACRTCKKVKDSVRDEYCGRKQCGSANSMCRDCTTERTCFTCGGTFCACRFVKCCVRDCQNYMCHRVTLDSNPYDDDDDEEEEDDDGKELGCSFVLYPEELYSDVDDELDEHFELEALEAEKRKYCKVHKPAGAIKFREFCE
jgi:hypothetical protein